MKEKSMFGKFVGDNKSTIIKGTLIVAGVVAGIAVIVTLRNNSKEQLLELVEDLNPEELTDGLKTISDVVNP